MFFLSKLLPLFVYPLGLSSLLMALGLVWLWKQPRRASGAIALALFILFFSSNPVVSEKFVSTLEQQYLPPNPVPIADAIVVLGGATHPASAPRPWVEVSERGDRILYAARLYNQKRAPKLILSGGRITWQGGGNSPSEADDMKEFALAMGVPANDIVLEGTSLNTRQNAVNVQKILQEQSIDTVLLVTSAIHMPRSIAIFNKLGINSIPAPTDYLVSTDGSATTTWEGRVLSLLPDAEALDEFTRVLKEYVGFAVYRLRGWV
ncbi:MAG: YdcF family protein [Cyanobacteria bacterium J06597_16]